jgi:hypothetical protein
MMIRVAQVKVFRFDCAQSSINTTTASVSYLASSSIVVGKVAPV